MKRTLLMLLFLIMASVAFSATEAQASLDYNQKRAAGQMGDSLLLDFSYAGYHFSEQPIPDVSVWNTIDITSYGVVADDAGFDDAAIQSAISAAEAYGVPTVVYFPAEILRR